MIIICELCNAAVHQTCHGGEIANKVPQDQWFCDRCKTLKENEKLKCRDIECFLCNDVKGVMKNVDKASNIWAHIICVNWTPGITFANKDKTKIKGKLEL